MKNVALIVAAGRGTRLGDFSTPKQYLPLGAALVLRRTINAFLTHPDIDAVKVVIHPDDQDLYQKTITGLNILPPALGGKTRQESVKNGLEGLTAEKILIHDAARPFIDHTTITRVINAIQPGQGAIPVLPIADTLKQISTDKITTIARDHLVAAQTPQGFTLNDAHHIHQNDHQATDDSMLAEQAGLKMVTVPGHVHNFKITTPEDYQRAQTMIRTEIRTGTGFDVHAFEPGDHVILCGIKIPHTHKLKGHSDADVALHAITDAILGAIGGGDIGVHFPPSDPQYKNMNSAEFVKTALAMLAAKGGTLINIDVTIIAEHPKITPHRDAMLKNLNKILGISTDRINIKATTTEGLGFTGRGEGIAAQAIANVALPTETGF